MSYLTAEEVLIMCEEYCKEKGNPLVAKAMRESFKRSGEIPRAAMKTLNLERVILYKLVSA